MTQKHTPGPWEVKTSHLGLFINDGQGYIITGPVNERPDGKYNASLISSAPDLLEALKGMIRHTEITGKDHREIDGRLVEYDAVIMARAAIAKAEGK